MHLSQSPAQTNDFRPDFSQVRQTILVPGVNVNCPDTDLGVRSSREFSLFWQVVNVD
jgi:hypothetical protein